MFTKVYINYRPLFHKVSEAKHRRDVKMYDGVIHYMIYYLYSQLKNGIQNDRFSGYTFDGRIVLFRIKLECYKAFVYTLHKHASEEVKYFGLENASKENIINALKSATGFIDLSIKEGELLEIYMKVEKEEP